MHFLIEKQSEEHPSVDVFVLKNNLKNWKFVHTSEEVTKEEIKKYENKENVVPVGDIEFVNRFLEINYNKTMIPIEIPNFLQKEEFLKRKYQIVKKAELPKQGKYFLKDAEKLKSFVFNNEISVFELHTDRKWSEFDENHLFVLSESVEIESEYRVFISKEEVQGVQYYNGDCMEFPDQKCKEMLLAAIKEISEKEKKLKSYTIDIAKIKNRGWAIIEIHSHVSVGLYGYDTYSLCNNYIEGIEYYKEKN